MNRSIYGLSQLLNRWLCSPCNSCFGYNGLSYLNSTFENLNCVDIIGRTKEPTSVIDL